MTDGAGGAFAFRSTEVSDGGRAGMAGFRSLVRLSTPRRGGRDEKAMKAKELAQGFDRIVDAANGTDPILTIKRSPAIVKKLAVYGVGTC